MSVTFDDLPFRPADILLPQGCDLSLWSVVACDQYTSQPEYWQRVEDRVGRAPSSLRLILPESCLEGPGVETDLRAINHTMTRYLREGRFRSLPDCLLSVERTLEGGTVRRGLIGMVDLEQYDYEQGLSAPVRATEQTVLSRIPPRVAVRKNAPIELPHAVLLMDDPGRTAIEPLSARTGEMEAVYDFDLMEGGGHIRGWALTEAQKDHVAPALRALSDPAAFRARYGLTGDEAPLLFAVGDGNHSLATAKECWERQKRLTPPENWSKMPARYALCELENLHDDGVSFLPIHRVVFGARPEEVLDALSRHYPDALRGRRIDESIRAKAPCVSFVYRGGEGELAQLHSGSSLEAGALQDFLDGFLAQRPGTRVDYIHGDGEAQALARAREDTIAFLLPPMRKDALFPAVIRSGALPRKTFSLGRAQDKRFYLEARKIRI